MSGGGGRVWSEAVRHRWLGVGARGLRFWGSRGDDVLGQDGPGPSGLQDVALDEAVSLMVKS